jgi:succinate dehydrogenase hydrophobic anchor subunit
MIMSLKAFHVFFITVATLITAAFGLWAVWQAVVEGGVAAFVLAAVAVLTAVALPIYGVWFLKKTKAVSFL